MIQTSDSILNISSRAIYDGTPSNFFIRFSAPWTNTLQAGQPWKRRSEPCLKVLKAFHADLTTEKKWPLQPSFPMQIKQWMKDTTCALLSALLTCYSWVTHTEDINRSTNYQKTPKCALNDKTGCSPYPKRKSHDMGI